jgi:hypothetical protein
MFWYSIENFFEKNSEINEIILKGFQNSVDYIRMIISDDIDIDIKFEKTRFSNICHKLHQYWTIRMGDINNIIY